MKLAIINDEEYLAIKDVAEKFEIPYPTLFKYLIDNEYEFELFGKNKVYKKVDIIRVATKMKEYREAKKQIK